MGLTIIDPTGQSHEIESLDDIVLSATLDVLHKRVKELKAENIELRIDALDSRVKKGYAELKLRRTQEEVAELQKIVDTSISALDPDRG